MSEPLSNVFNLHKHCIRMEILVARMRACHEETGKHELMDEAEMFLDEFRQDLDQLLPDIDKLTEILRYHGCERGIAKIVINSMPQWINKG